MSQPSDLIDDALRRLRSWLAGRDDYGRAILDTLLKPTTKGEINRLRDNVGGKLPEALEALYLRIGGQNESENRDYTWTGLLPTALEPDYPAFRMVTPDEAIDESPVDGVLMLGEHQGGDRLFIDCRDGAGRLLHFFHEEGGYVEAAESLEAYFSAVADDLESGRIEMDEEQGMMRPEAPEHDEGDNETLD